MFVFSPPSVSGFGVESRELGPLQHDLHILVICMFRVKKLIEESVLHCPSSCCKCCGPNTLALFCCCDWCMLIALFTLHRNGNAI